MPILCPCEYLAQCESLIVGNSPFEMVSVAAFAMKVLLSVGVFYHSHPCSLTFVSRSISRRVCGSKCFNSSTFIKNAVVTLIWGRKILTKGLIAKVRNHFGWRPIRWYNWSIPVFTCLWIFRSTCSVVNNCLSLGWLLHNSACHLRLMLLFVQKPLSVVDNEITHVFTEILCDLMQLFDPA